MAANPHGVGGHEKGVRGYRLEQDRIVQGNRIRARGAPGGAEIVPSVARFGGGDRVAALAVPAAAVESGQGDAAPMDGVGDRRSALHLNAHDHRGAAFDLADLAELYVLGEAGDKRGLEIEAREKAGVEARQDKEDAGAGNHGAQGNGRRGDAQGGMQAARHGSADLERRRRGALRASPHLEANKGGNRQHQVHEEKDQEGGVHGQNCGGQHGGKAQHGQEQVIARGVGAIQAHDHGKQHEVNGRQKRRKQHTVLRVNGQQPRNPLQRSTGKKSR